MNIKNALKPFFSSRILVMMPLGFASGVPLVLTSATLQAWYTDLGVSIVTIGLLALVGQPYIYKFLWAPLLDRYQLPFLGRRRGWALFFQTCILLFILLMATLSPKSTPLLVASIALLICILSASQDIVLDAYRVDVLDSQERGLGTAWFVSGYRIAMVVAGGLALILADHIGWKNTYLLLGLSMSIGIVATLFSPEPKEFVTAPATLKDAVILPFRDFMTRPLALQLLLLVVLYKLSDAFAGTLSTAFLLRGVGFTLTQVGMVNKIIGMLATIVGALWGGALMLRWGLYRSLIYFGILQGISNLGYFALSIIGPHLPSMVVVLTLEHICSGMGTAAFLAFIMALCNPNYSATQFALLSALSAIGRVFVGPIAATMVSFMGWTQFYLWTVLFALPALMLLWSMRDHILEIDFATA